MPTPSHAPMPSHSELNGFLTVDPGNLLLRRDAFHAALRERLWDAASVHIEAMRQDATLPAPQLRLLSAELLMAQEHWAQAGELLAEALAESTQAPPELQEQLAVHLSFVLMKRGDFGGAKQALDIFVRGDASKSGSSAKRQWLRATHFSGELDEALAACKAWDLQRALAGDLLGSAAMVALDSGDSALALAWSNRALSNGPDVAALIVRGTIQLGAGEQAGAQQTVAEAIRLAPMEGRGWSLMAFVAMQARDFSGARQAFDKALELQPSHIGTWHGRAWLNVMQDELQAAKSDFEAAMNLDRNFAETHGGLGVVAAMAGDAREANAHVERAERLSRNCASAQYAKLLLRGQGKDAARVTALAKAIVARSLRQEPGASAPDGTSLH